MARSAEGEGDRVAPWPFAAGSAEHSVSPPVSLRVSNSGAWYQTHQTEICTRHESGRRGWPWSGPVRQA
jgi:hypothetical protein